MQIRWTKAAVGMAALAALVAAGCSGDEAKDGTPTATGAGVEGLDFVYQASVDDPASAGGDDGIAVFVSIGGVVRRVDQDAPGGRHKHPVWTNDGSQVAFIAEAEWDGQGTVVRASEVWVVDPTGENAKPLITCDCWDLDNAAWSPDGKRVAYVEYDAPVDPASNLPPAASRIVVLDLTTGERTVAVRSEAGELVDIPHWSPDGVSLVVSIDRFDDRGSETGSSFGVIPASGADTVTPLLPFEEFAYSADWNWVTGALVFSVEGQGYAWSDPKVSPWDLFEIQPDGSGRRTITNVADEQRLYLPMWSSDGSLIAASLDTTPNEFGGSLVVVVDAKTGVVTPLGPEGGRARLRPSSHDEADASAWISDLEAIDSAVRNVHADPFAVVPEAMWSARVAELENAFPSLDDNERIVGMASLAGLLDTHTQFFGPDQRIYDVWLYRFSDGLFVIAADDPSLVGARLVSINGVAAADVEARIRPLLPGDNESAELNAMWMAAQVDYLHGLGIVDDPERPAFTFAMSDGTERTVDLPTADIDDFVEQQHLLGSLGGDRNEALRRRDEPIWTRIDAPTKVFLLSLNDYTSTGLDEAIADITRSLDSGAADHVVVDMRYLRGGDASRLLPIVDALGRDPRINRPGGLTVLIGRENESAATVIATALDVETEAAFVGEMTPARADNFLGPNTDIELAESGFIFSVPTRRAGNGDPRMAIEPDLPIALSSIDYFAGRDPALEAARSAGAVAPAPGEEWVAFRSPRPDGRDGIFLARPDGSDRHQLVADLPFVQASPAWSPDGTRLAFIERNPDEALWAVDADGSNATELVPASTGCCGQDKPDWSPDGTTIAFVRWIGPEDAITSEIALYDLATGDITVSYSSKFPTVLDRPRWSPDGTLLAVDVTTMQPNGSDFAAGAIGLIDLRSGLLEELTDSGHFFAYASWNPSGTALVFESEGLSYWNDTPAGRATNLWTINADGSDLRQITDNEPGGHRATQPFWRADDSICYVDAEAKQSDRHLVRCLGADLRPLPDPATPIQGTHPRFRPLP
jgi:Tol biopolymer transport system component